MKPKRILSDGVLHILIDSESLLQSYKANPKSLTFLHYRHEKYFDIKRTPTETGVPEIDDIPPFENVIDTAANSGSIRYTQDDSSHLIRITDDLAEIEERHMRIFNEPAAKYEDWKRIWNVFVHAHLGHDTVSNIYITSDDTILKNRDHFATYPVGNQSVNILSIEEGGEVMDIFAKNLGYCLMLPAFGADLSIYYMVAFRLCLPHYNDPTAEELRDEKGAPYEDLQLHHAMPTRFIYALKCMDKMGIGHYRGIDYFTNFDIHFYFNYLMILVSGIFDSLALDTRKRYKISFKGDHIPSRTSLNRNAGENFLKAVKASNCGLYDHIAANGRFIDLVYHFREMIIHRDFRVPVIQYTPAGMGGGLMKVEHKVAEYLSRLEDKKSKYGEHSEWGYIKDDSGGHILPYIFSKRALQKLINFVDGYLEKLGFDDVVVDNIGDIAVDNINDVVSRQIQAFREGDLCRRFPRNILWCNYRPVDPEKFWI